MGSPSSSRGLHTVQLASAGAKPSQAELRRLIAQDALPDMIGAADALNAALFDERHLALVPGLRGRLLRRLPAPLALAVEVWRSRHDFDVILTWGETYAFPVAAVMSLTRSPRPGHIAILMWPFDASSPSRLKRAVKKVVFGPLARRGIDRMCVPAPAQRRLAMQRWRIPVGRIVPVQWPVDTRFWRPMSAAQDTICSVGREMRDYATLIEALRPLEIPCHIAAGTNSVNAAVSSVDSRARNMAGRLLPETVTAGPKSPVQLRQLYARSRMVVLPILATESDNGVSAVIEAMAMGRAVIATDTAGRADILEDGLTCVLVAPGDVLALRAAIEDLWNDPDRCARLGAEARRRVSVEHGLDQWVAGLVAAATDVAVLAHPRETAAQP